MKANADETPWAAWGEALRSSLSGAWPTELHATADSTQRLARDWVSATPEAAARRLFVADHQTAGRGQRGRSWYSPAGASLALTAALPHGDRPAETLSVAASVAVAEAVDRWLAPAGHAAAVKWPNDIYAGGRKLAGLLIERVGRHALIGVGVNVGQTAADFPPELRETATSTAMLGVAVERVSLLVEIVRRLDRVMQASPDAACARWNTRVARLDVEQTLEHRGQTFTGRVLRLDGDRRLVLRDRVGVEYTLPAAAVSVVRA
ncbi:MAG: biotin--[acetyl-CoA-carboxylase] ligase [Planctomycetota bacterium]